MASSSSESSLSIEDRRRAASQVKHVFTTKLAVTVDGGGTLDQTPATYVRALEDIPGWGDPDIDDAQPTEEALLMLAESFLFGSMSAEAFRALMLQREPEVKRILKNAYALQPMDSLRTDSITSPELLFASVANRETMLLLDNSQRLVIKMYRLSETLRSSDEAKVNMIDIATDIIVGFYLTRLTLGLRTIATPHFAYILDWFVGPTLNADAVKHTRNAKTRRVGVDEDLPFVAAPADEEDIGELASQYAVVERVDYELEKFLKSELMSPYTLIGQLFALLFTLEVAWKAMGFLHYDFHVGNSMMRALSQEPDSPYLNRTWEYKRAQFAQPYYLTPRDHGNLFAEIIDFGRSRIFVPHPDDPDRLVLVGSSAFTVFGVHPSGPRVDRSWDIRRLGLDLLQLVDVDALIERSLPSTTTPFRDILVTNLRALGDEIRILIAVLADIQGLAHAMHEHMVSTRPSLRTSSLLSLRTSLAQVAGVTSGVGGRPLRRYFSLPEDDTQLVVIPAATRRRLLSDYAIMSNLATGPSRKQFEAVLYTWGSQGAKDDIYLNREGIYANPSLNASTALNLPIFSRLRSVSVEDREMTLRVAELRPEDVMVDPLRGVPSDTPIDGPAMPDPMSLSPPGRRGMVRRRTGSPAQRRVRPRRLVIRQPAASRSPSPMVLVSKFQESALNASAQEHGERYACGLCGQKAVGYLQETHAKQYFCGEDCMRTKMAFLNVHS